MMKTRFFLTAAALAVLMPAAAQETYENAKIATEDLNGTARYVGMGGAGDALGADISTISTNPAGIGLFRHSKVDVSAGMVSQQNASDYSEGDATNLSFDQAGFVWVARKGDSSFFNFAFNYHKSRNFDYILSADDRLNEASQNKLTYIKLFNDMLYPVSSDGYVDDEHPYHSCNQLDDIYFRNLLYASGEDNAYYYPAEKYLFDRAHKGYIGEYDFNFSGNINDRVYLGVTMGIHDVHYRHASDYTETLMNNPENITSLNVYDERKITGTGIDVKVGAIFRPIEYSPFLLGLSIHTPTWYDLNTRNYTEVSDGSYTAYANESYDYKVYTPWKFGLSAGYTIGQTVAIGAAFEYADYGSMSTRVNTGTHYDYYWGDAYTSSEKDKEMNRHTERTLKGVSTLKVGVEVKPIKEMALRAGYNLSTALYNKDGFKDGTLQSNGSYYASATDFTNWKNTNRFTCGVGFNLDRFNLDLAYQYSTSEGDFYPFMSYSDKEFYDYDNKAGAVKVENKRHQLLFTLGYTF